MSSTYFEFIEKLQHSKSSSADLNFALHNDDRNLIVLQKPIVLMLRVDEQKGLQNMYTNLYGPTIHIKTISAYALQSESVLYAGEKISRRQLVKAKWPLEELSERIGEVRNILKHKLILDLNGKEHEVEHLAIEAWWYKNHSQMNYYQPPCVIVQNIYDSSLSGLHYLPIQRVLSRCSYAIHLKF